MFFYNSFYNSFYFFLFISYVSGFQNRYVYKSSNLLYNIRDSERLSSGIEYIGNKVVPHNNTRINIKWLPFGNIKASPILDGSFAGDVGFDPLEFSSSKNALYWMREAEIKHARLAMLAAVGWPLSELWHKPIAQFLHMDSILGGQDRAPSILNGGLSSVYSSGVLISSLLIAGYLENNAMNSGKIFWNSEKPTDYIPGDLGFDPLGLYNKRDGDKKSMETTEIKNGRLAMIAITIYVIQEALYKTPVIEQSPFLF